MKGFFCDICGTGYQRYVPYTIEFYDGQSGRPEKFEVCPEHYKELKDRFTWKKKSLDCEELPIRPQNDDECYRISKDFPCCTCNAPCDQCWDHHCGLTEKWSAEHGFRDQ